MKKRVIIVGGVAGGASCAARLRRLDETAEIIILEKGLFISFANCGLPYYIGDTIKDRGDLILETLQTFKARFNADVRIESEVTAIDASARMVTIRHGSKIYQEHYDILVLSPGCSPIRPPIKGIDSPVVFTLRTIPDTDRIRSHIDQHPAARAVVIGGGFIGLEMAENLHERGWDVSLVELLDQVFAPADKEMASILHQHLIKNGIHLILQDKVEEIVPIHDQCAEVLLKSGKRLCAECIILAIGVKPDTDFVKSAGIHLGERGTILVDDQMRTSQPDIFAVGDAIETVDWVSGNKVHIPLAGPANRQGRIAADNIAGIASKYQRTQGTAICKVFDLTGALTGLSEKNAKKWKISFCKSYTHSPHHASYYPGAFTLSIKILFDPKTGKLLGAQVIGKEGVDKRIDVFATALRHGLTVADLSALELGYAPPFGSAKDPVNIMGFVAQNVLQGIMPVFYAEDIPSINPETQTLLDVRTFVEYEKSSIENSLCIPVDTLRDRILELDKNKEILVYCAVGLRGYLATRILLQNGFKAKNLSGGYKTYTHWVSQ